MKKWKGLKRKISTTIMASVLILSTTATNAWAIENPGQIQWRAGQYFIYLPTSPSDYTFDRVGNAMLNIKNPVLGYTSSLIKKSYSKPLTQSEIQKGEQALADLLNDKLKDARLSAIPKKQRQLLAKGKNLYGTVTEVTKTAKDLKEFKKNDTTNYALNFVLGTRVNLISKSSLGAIAKYNYASQVINPLIKSGDIKITWAKKGQSTLRSKATYSKKANEQIVLLRKDLEIINKEFEKRGIK